MVSDHVGPEWRKAVEGDGRVGRGVSAGGFDQHLVAHRQRDRQRIRCLFVEHISRVAGRAGDHARLLHVGVLRGSGDADYLKSFGFTVEEANTQAQNIDKLLANRFDLWATDVLSANFFIQKRGKAAAKEVLTFRATLSSLACQVDMDKGDLARLQETLDRLIKEGVLQKLTATVQ